MPLSIGQEIAYNNNLYKFGFFKYGGTMLIRGKVWRFGNDVDTDAIIPARYLNTSDPKELAKHVMEDADKDFAGKVSAGDSLLQEKTSAAVHRESMRRLR